MQLDQVACHVVGILVVWDRCIFVQYCVSRSFQDLVEIENVPAGTLRRLDFGGRSRVGIRENIKCTIYVVVASKYPVQDVYVDRVSGPFFVLPLSKRPRLRHALA